MSKSVSTTCPVCSEQYNDHTRLPLTTSCGHTTCATCLRSHTLQCHPDAEPGREGQVPSGKEIKCQQCQESVNTDQLVIDRSVLARLPLSLEDLIITDTQATNDPHPPSQDDPQPSLTPTATPAQPPDPAQPQDHTAPLHPETQQGLSQIPTGWSLPPQHIEMDPYHPQPPHSQPGVVGWATSPSHPPQHPHPSHPPHQMPLPPHGYPGHPSQHPPHHDPSHHHHAHDPHHTPYPAHDPHAPHPHSHSHTPALVAGAGGLAVGAAAGYGISAHKKTSKGKKKQKKRSKERKHRSSSSSSSSSSGSDSDSKKKHGGRRRRSSSSSS